MSEIDVAVEESPTAETRQRIIDGLVSFNDGRAGQAGHAEIAIVARRDDEIVAGLLGYTNWNWLFIAQLWVADDARREGLGRRLVAAAEAEACRRGCSNAHVDTFSFQALGFYERIGYTVFGRLDDYPPGHARYFLLKRGLS